MASKVQDVDDVPRWAGEDADVAQLTAYTFQEWKENNAVSLINRLFVRPYVWKPNYTISSRKASRKEIPIGNFPIGILV